MKKSKIRLILLIVASVALVVSLTIGGTLAWLTAQSDTLINTFTVGKITMTLDEAPVDEDGHKTTGTRIDSKTNSDTDNAYKIIPGATIDKDPTITIGANSEDCYVFAAVKTNLPSVDTPNQKIIATWTIGTNWKVADSYTDKDGDTVTIYVYSDTSGPMKVTTTATDPTPLPAIFETITFKGAELTATELDALGTAKIEIAAYAHQSANITSVDVAKTAATAQFQTVFPLS